MALTPASLAIGLIDIQKWLAAQPPLLANQEAAGVLGSGSSTDQGADEEESLEVNPTTLNLNP